MTCWPSSFSYALDSRVLIEQAKGTLATRLDIDHDEAFALLHQRARGQHRSLREVAAEVTATRPDGDWQQFRSLRLNAPWILPIRSRTRLGLSLRSGPRHRTQPEGSGCSIQRSCFVSRIEPPPPFEWKLARSANSLSRDGATV